MTADVTGFVVAGGRSRRMGRDKALLPWGRATLLDHALARLTSVCGTVHILSGPAPRYGDRASEILDAVPDGGPLAGLSAALATLAPDGLAVLLAVDLPLVPESLLRFLVEAVAGSDAVVPVTGDGPQPLCAAYRATCGSAVAERLAAGERRMTSFWPDVVVRTLDEEALTAFGEPARLFLNVNDPQSLDRARTFSTPL